MMGLGAGPVGILKLLRFLFDDAAVIHIVRPQDDVRVHQIFIKMLPRRLGITTNETAY